MICITGAGGTLGKEILKQLRTESIKFRAAFFSKEKVAEARTEGIDAVAVDYNNLETLRTAFLECDKIFLLAPNLPNQTQLELNAVEMAKVAGVKHIVKLSVLGAYEELFDIAKIHRRVECAIESSGMRWTFLRSNRFMQNIVTYMRHPITAESTLYSTSGEAKVSHVDVRDVAAVAVKTLVDPVHEGKAYNLTGSEALTYSQIAVELSKVLGRQIDHISVPPSLWRKSLLDEGLPEETIDRMLDLERCIRESEIGSSVTDSIKQVTGFDPRRFSAFAKESVQSLQTSS
ncbi:MAG: SDR family oxidoreductase [Alteromonadaceae bacterium]|nr:SDR family oxidoreductase [Alteromonadaceae bacterium]